MIQLLYSKYTNSIPEITSLKKFFFERFSKCIELQRKQKRKSGDLFSITIGQESVLSIKGGYPPVVYREKVAAGELKTAA